MSSKSIGVSGFRFAGVCAGLKASGKADIALISSARACVAAGLFTTNRFPAAPVLVCQQALRDAPAGIHAIAVNSGQANACTGQEGLMAAQKMKMVTEEALGVPAGGHALVMSTGVIGALPDASKIEAGIKDAASKLDTSSWSAAADAIMTTDLAQKSAFVQFPLSSGKNASILGIAKGSGMIHPNMATMLCAFVSDIAVDEACLHSALSFAADRSFHCIDVDGDTSTNDSMVVLANGALDNHRISDETSDDFGRFRDALCDASVQLAKKVVMDGEGATKFLSVKVSGAASFTNARTVAQTIAQSSLVKTAAFGGDPNWGRILAAAGYSGVQFDPSRVCLRLSGSDGLVQELVRAGEPVQLSATELQRATQIMQQRKIDIDLDLDGVVGNHSATVWASDLSYDYVKINAEYTT